MARQGKIARLPHGIREELNLRLVEGQSAPKILPWLNALPETRQALDEGFEGNDITEQNLSEWRKGGLVDWQNRRELLARKRDLVTFSMDLAKDGGHLSDGASAIAAGKFLEILEGFGDTAPDVETLSTLAAGIAKLRSGDHNAEKIRQTSLRLDQTAELLALERQKFQRTTCEMFVKYAADQRAHDLATAPGDNTARIEALGQHLFGDLWESAGGKAESEKAEGGKPSAS